MANQTLGKRKQPLASGLQRRVRARKEVEPEPESDAGRDESGEDAPSEQGISDEDEDEDESEAETPLKATNGIAAVSFGALAKAQASMPSGRRGKKGGAESSEDSDSDDAPEEYGAKHKKYGGSSSSSRQQHRTSKHAPMEVTSKRPVSRKRDLPTILKPQPRDPRFDPAVSSTPGYDEARAKKSYAFLDDYRDSEMADLRGEIRKTKDAAEKERLKRLLMSMQNRKKNDEKKDRERRVLDEHRQREKELVKQGKQPFYLKKSEQKKRVLTDQFQNMRKKQVDKVIERRRKKASVKEKIELEQLERRR